MAYYENWETGDVITADRLNSMGYVISVSVDHYFEDTTLMVLDINYNDLKELMHDRRLVVLTDEDDRQYIFVSTKQLDSSFRAYAVTVTGGSIDVITFASDDGGTGALTEVGVE